MKQHLRVFFALAMALSAVGVLNAQALILYCPAEGAIVVGELDGERTFDLIDDPLDPGNVTLSDLARFAASFNKSPDHPSFTICADYNADGLVTVADYAIFASHYHDSGPFIFAGPCW